MSLKNAVLTIAMFVAIFCSIFWALQQSITRGIRNGLLEAWEIERTSTVWEEEEFDE